MKVIVFINEMKRRKPSEQVLKILFAKSGNTCAFPGCKDYLIADENDASKPLGEMAHIIAAEDSGPRSDPKITTEERNLASNYILLCPTHHALIDKFPYQYNVFVLREMKRRHESQYESNKAEESSAIFKNEVLYSSLLPLSRIPIFVFSAETKYRKDTILDLFEVINIEENRNKIMAFELKDKRIYTFFNLSDSDNPFREVYEPNSVETQKAIEMWKDPDSHRLYVSLLNRALRRFLRNKGIGYDIDHYRYYFRPHKTTTERKFTFRSLAGKKTRRTVVRQPVTKATGLPKKYWVHDAASLIFNHVDEREWILTIRPERHITKDGYQPYDHSYIGRKITRIKSTMYNWNYMQDLQLWREFITEANPRTIIHFGKQSLTIENKLLNSTISWPGISEDTRDFVAQTHEEDLFTLSELAEIDVNEGELDPLSEEDLRIEEET